MAAELEEAHKRPNQRCGYAAGSQEKRRPPVATGAANEKDYGLAGEQKEGLIAHKQGHGVCRDRRKEGHPGGLTQQAQKGQEGQGSGADKNGNSRDVVVVSDGWTVE